MCSAARELIEVRPVHRVSVHRGFRPARREVRQGGTLEDQIQGCQNQAVLRRRDQIRQADHRSPVLQARRPLRQLVLHRENSQESFPERLFAKAWHRESRLACYRASVDLVPRRGSFLFRLVMYQA